jgi:hypothetical protein
MCLLRLRSELFFLKWGLGLMRFWTLSIVRYSKEHQITPLEYRTMDKVQTPSNPKGYTTSSEPFKIYTTSVVY